MKKWKRALISTLTACTLLMVNASAATFTQTADTLKNMGLFAGTSTGYELDRAPTRAEAATMLVRLLGKTAEAESEWDASGDTFAFRDMDDFDWAKPYVHWLSVNQLAAGTSADRFTPSAECTAQMYAAFLMRALGYYESNGDFAFDDAISFARSHGVINNVNYSSSSFLRDHVVAMSYTALAAAPKSGGNDLLTRLVNDGAVSSSSASAELQKFTDYRGYAQIMQQTSKEVSLQNVTSFSISGGLSLDIAAVSEANLRGNTASSKSSLTITRAGENPFVQERTGYYAGGRWYTSTDGAKTWIPMSSAPFAQPEAVPLLLIDSIRTDSTKYILTYNSIGQTHYQTLLRQLLQTSGNTSALQDLTINSLNAEIEVEDRTLTSLSTSVTASGKYAGSDVAVTAQQSSKITATGEQVSVQVPSDLSSYTQAS